MNVNCVASTVGLFDQEGEDFDKHIGFENGLPNGPINMPSSGIYDYSSGHLIKTTQWRVPVSKVKVPFDRGIHPDITYGKMVGTLNRTAFSLFGLTHVVKPFELLMEGIFCKTVATTSGYRYGGHFVLSYRKGGHREQTAHFGRPVGADTQRPRWYWYWNYLAPQTIWPASLS